MSPIPLILQVHFHTEYVAKWNVCQSSIGLLTFFCPSKNSSVNDIKNSVIHLSKSVLGNSCAVPTRDSILISSRQSQARRCLPFADSIKYKAFPLGSPYWSNIGSIMRVDPYWTSSSLELIEKSSNPVYVPSISYTHWSN